ncbi:hypothetical protein V2A60_006250 [Cordyceps javanica]
MSSDVESSVPNMRNRLKSFGIMKPEWKTLTDHADRIIQRLEKERDAAKEKAENERKKSARLEARCQEAEADARSLEDELQRRGFRHQTRGSYGSGEDLRGSRSRSNSHERSPGGMRGTGRRGSDPNRHVHFADQAPPGSNRGERRRESTGPDQGRGGRQPSPYHLSSDRSPRGRQSSPYHLSSDRGHGDRQSSPYHHPPDRGRGDRQPSPYHLSSDQLRDRSSSDPELLARKKREYRAEHDRLAQRFDPHSRGPSNVHYPETVLPGVPPGVQTGMPVFSMPHPPPPPMPPGPPLHPYRQCRMTSRLTSQAP